MTGRRGGIRHKLILSAAIAAVTISPAAQAQEAKPASIWTQETLTGDWGGARTRLKEKYGIDITLNYIGETFGVLSGGLHRAATYEHRFEFSVDTDLSKYGWNGASTHFTIFQIANGGRNAVDNVGSIADPSNIDALRTTRLFTALKCASQIFGLNSE
jgi:porin